MADKAKSKFVVGANASRFASISKNKTFFLIIGTLIVIIIIAGIVYGLMWKKSNDQTVAEKEQDSQLQHGVDQINSGNYEEALSSNKQLVENLPADSSKRYDALVSLGISYVATGKTDEALKTLLEAEAIKKEQTSYSVFVTIGQIYTMKNEKPKAIEYYQKAIERTKVTPEDADDLYVPGYEAAIKELQQ